ncbi:DsrE family protein [Pantoea sp. A4]|uniref:DsrE family protein n=1 Tax=Pantoea sp. A4 TaxID=1225184 RepID=UPI00037D574E|nr:DsrE family protein [Pantoea sp. A4]
MRSVLSYALIAIIGGAVGAGVVQAGGWYDQAATHLTQATPEPAGFWSTPAIAGYGKIHYVDTPAYKPGTVSDLSNKVVFQINKYDGDLSRPNISLERVARMVNLYSAAGVPLNKLDFVVSMNGSGVLAGLTDAQYHKAYKMDNPNLPLIDALEKAGVKITVCDQSVAFEHLHREWIDTRITHTISSGTTVATLENQGYALLML